MSSQLRGATRLYPIIGDPVRYTESPVRLTRTFGDRGHAVTPFIGAAQAAGFKTADGGHMVEASRTLWPTSCSAGGQTAKTTVTETLSCWVPGEIGTDPFAAAELAAAYSGKG